MTKIAESCCVCPCHQREFRCAECCQGIAPTDASRTREMELLEARLLEAELWNGEGLHDGFPDNWGTCRVDILKAQIAALAAEREKAKEEK